MNKINNNKTNNINFEGVKPAKVEVKNMEQDFRKMLNQILARAEREVPEYGDFAPVYEEVKNIDRSLCPTDFMIKIYKLPKRVENDETARMVELIAFKFPAPYQASRGLAYGTKEEILRQLKSGEMIAKMEETAKKLSEDLIDI